MGSKLVKAFVLKLPDRLLLICVDNVSKKSNLKYNYQCTIKNNGAYELNKMSSKIGPKRSNF